MVSEPTPLPGLPSTLTPLPLSAVFCACMHECMGGCVRAREGAETERGWGRGRGRDCVCVRRGEGGGEGETLYMCVERWRE